MPIRIASEESLLQGVDAGNIFGLPDADPARAQLPAGISLCMIMKNEERFLEQCLSSIVGCVDEICIVDTGSTDRSLEIAEKYGARLSFIEWPNDFGKARNASLEMAKYRWILSLDADEELAPECREALKLVRSAPARDTAVSIRIHNQIDGTSGDNIYTHYLPRLFPNSERIRYAGAVHERLEFDHVQAVNMVDSPIHITHHGYRIDIIEGREKSKRNIPLVRREAAENPEDMFCLFNLAMMQVSNDEGEEGIATFEKMFAIAEKQNIRPASAGYFATSYVTLAQAYALFHNDYEKAHEILAACLEHHPYYPNALFLQANIYGREGKIDEMRDSLRTAIEGQEQSRRYAFVDEEVTLWRAKYMLAMSYAAEEKYEDALAWFDRALLARRDIWEVRLSYARVIERAGRPADAERAFSEMHRDFASDEAYSEYVLFLVRRRRFAKAFDVINRYIDTVEDDAKVRMLLTAASLAHRQGFGDPQSFIDRALSLQAMPLRGDNIRLLDDLYAELERIDERADLRGRELSEPPESVVRNDFVRRSFRYLEERHYEAARDSARAGLEISPKAPELLYNAAAACMQTGESEEAIRHLGNLDPLLNKEVYLTGMYLRAILLQRAGRPREALQAIESLLIWDAHQPDALFFKASLLEELGRFDEAMSLLQSALPEHPDRAGMQLFRLYWQAGREEEAMRFAAGNLAAVESGAGAHS
jgi:glycosyltransferase involved in cell wall biosynthesis